VSPIARLSTVQGIRVVGRAGEIKSPGPVKRRVG
jgi:hypothetical protein